MDNLIYRTFSGLLFFKHMIVMAILGGLIFILAFHYDQNPDVFFYFILILVGVMFWISQDVIEIYPDKFVIKKSHAFGLFSRKKVFDHYFVKSIGVVGEFDTKSDLTEDVIGLFIGGSSRDILNTIEIITNEGQTKSFNVRIYKNEILTALKKMHEESNYDQTIAKNAKLTERVKQV